MFNRLSVWVAVAGLMTNTIRAQSVVSVAAEQNSSGNHERSVTISVRNVTLKEALAEVSRQSGTVVRIGDDVLTSKAKVSVSVSGVSPREAVSVILKGTGFELSNSAVGGLMVVGQSARSQGVIVGKVTDAKTGKGVSGASISVGNNAGGATSGEDGSYRLNSVAIGTHTVSVRLVGYTKQSRSVTISEGATATVDFKLEPSANVLDQVIVTGTVVQTELKAVPNAITVITAKQIEERGITRIDQLFRGDIPGLFAVNMGSNALLDEVVMFSRGATALENTSLGGSTVNPSGALTNPIKTYIDGVEMVNPKYLSQIDPNSIERIEILTGPQASTIYGSNAINGVMQIFTKRGAASKPQLNLSMSTGIAQNDLSGSVAPSHLADATASGLEGRLSYSVGGSWNYIGSWTPAKQTQRISANGGGRMEFARITADLSARNGLTQNRQRGDMQGYATRLRATGQWSPILFTATQGLPVPQTQALLGQTSGLNLGFRPFSWWSNELGVGSDVSTVKTNYNGPRYSNSSDTTLQSNFSTSSRISERYSTTIQIPTSYSTGFNVTLGGDHWRTTGSSWSANGPSLTGTLGNPSVTRNTPSKNSGAFIQGQLSIKDALFFTYGVRADWNPNFGDNVKVKPGRYGVSFARDIGLVSAKLRGSYGRSIRPPADGLKLAQAASGAVVSQFGQYDRQLANPDLGPEHQQGGEGGIELYVGSRASLIVTRYNQTVDNLISNVGSFNIAQGPGLDSVRSIIPNLPANCSSDFRDADGYCYRYLQQNLNVGSIRNQGWEFSSTLTLGALTTRGTYSWAKSRILSVTPKYRAFLTTAAFTPGRPFDYLPEHTWALSWVYAHANSSLSLAINGIGARYVQENDLSLGTGLFTRLQQNIARISQFNLIYRPLESGYATADLNATHRFSSRVDGTLQVTNLSDYYPNDRLSNYPSMGRQSRIGARLRW